MMKLYRSWRKKECKTTNRRAHLQPVLCAISLHGIRIYDSKTDEEIKIPKEISTHRQSEKTEVLDPLGKSHPAAIYERGSLSHASGAKLWYLLEREKSEQNEKKLLYVSPERKARTLTMRRA